VASTSRGRAARTARVELSLDAAHVVTWLRQLAAELAVHRDHLTQLDAAIGDADHGLNMDRGFRAVEASLDPAQDLPPGELLRQSGATLMFRVGGAAGPLYGIAFREAGAFLGDEPTFGAEELLAALRAALAGVQSLGAAEEGDKTMVDAWLPALAAFHGSLRNASPADAIRAAAVAAEEGAVATTPMQARKGRASYLGARSIGHQDPGATSSALLFAALARAVEPAT
jgi:dihydroxyacetone kinase-like protein